MALISRMKSILLTLFALQTVRALTDEEMSHFNVNSTRIERNTGKPTKVSVTVMLFL